MFRLQDLGNIPANLIPNANITLAVLNEIDRMFPNQFSLNSAYRSTAHNANVGGVPDSFHLKALAFDITPKNGNYDQYESALINLASNFGWEVIDERKKNHFHLEPAAGGWQPIVKNTASGAAVFFAAIGLYLLLSD